MFLRMNNVYIKPLYQSMYLEHIYLFFLILFILSYNFHELWLFYDFFALALLVPFMQDLLYNRPKTILIFSGAFIFFTVATFLINGVEFISLLSLWDTMKHIPVMYGLLQLGHVMDEQRKSLFSQRLYNILSLFFLLQILLVSLQSGFILNQSIMDNVAGTFGDGATHSLAYFCILYIGLLIWQKKHAVLVLVVIFISVYLNYLSENVGFYVLLVFILLVKKPIYLVWTFVYIILLGWVDVDFGSFTFNIFLPRILSFFGLDNNYSISTAVEVVEAVRHQKEVATGRLPLLIYALELGSWMGQGPGFYSNIYGLDGSGYSGLKNTQLAISECTHLISEYGIIGGIVVIGLYVSVIQNNTKFPGVLIGIAFFLMCILYNRLLMDERLIYQACFIILILTWKSKIRSEGVQAK